MTNTAPHIAVTCGEPAGIGPEICLALCDYDGGAQVTVIGDPDLLQATAIRDNLPVEIVVGPSTGSHEPNKLHVLPCSVAKPVTVGRLDKDNAQYVIDTLAKACDGCLDGTFDAMVTAPVNKAVIMDAGFEFSGHTEWLADRCGVNKPVMLLTAQSMRVALATTHLPLAKVSDAISYGGLKETLTILATDLTRLFGIGRPHIAVTGLNPHAGENGHLGYEDQQIIEPAIRDLNNQGLNLSGPWPADTLFSKDKLADVDAVLAMFHDQGLPVIKYASFGQAVNVTLGLPIIRTSVDHGTALDIAGQGKAKSDSLLAAVDEAVAIAHTVKSRAPAT